MSNTEFCFKCDVVVNNYFPLSELKTKNSDVWVEVLSRKLTIRIRVSDLKFLLNLGLITVLEWADNFN